VDGAFDFKTVSAAQGRGRSHTFVELHCHFVHQRVFAEVQAPQATGKCHDEVEGVPSHKLATPGLEYVEVRESMGRCDERLKRTTETRNVQDGQVSESIPLESLSTRRRLTPREANECGTIAGAVRGGEYTGRVKLRVGVYEDTPQV